MIDGDGLRPEQGAVMELARDDFARKRFLRMAGKGIGSAAAASSLAAFITACGSSSSSNTPGANANAGASGASAPPGGDLGIVNYALTLEYLESEFYGKVVASGLFSGATLSTLKRFHGEENAHVRALHSVASGLGTPAKKPKGKFPLTNARSVAKLAATVENLGAGAYLGQAGNIKSKEILAAALSIHSVEARHAATLNMLLKLNPTPDGAFGKPLDMNTVLAAVKPFIA
jgi:hypothetical protein